MRVLTEYGMGTSLRRGDQTEAAARGLRDALWRNSIRAAEVFGRNRSEMRLAVKVGVPAPEGVDLAALRAVFPYGTPDFDVVEGGLSVPHPTGDGEALIMAAVSITVSFGKDT
ncbi:Lin0512 family protein [Sagittula stellata]|uniref:Uncharacterized protein n=1 Tax=Sagittula stellata (strain ATCC 700073 / DSM 11524 / E-37) TaxID=388399 RepID=A3K6H2_SAGS3|nr:Lin0512 family protein [Sagittula stellata]EBA07322.1 hypothetical protein SSE37_06784 [Sagittula stellata E-37]